MQQIAIAYGSYRMTQRNKATRRPRKMGTACNRPCPRFSFAPECVAANAGDLKRSLTALLAEPALTLDGAAVRRIDTAALQVIAAFVREHSARGLGFEWVASSPALDNGARLLGLTALLRLPA